MANVKVAVRVRPLSKRELAEGSSIIVKVDDKVARIRNVKLDQQVESPGDSRQRHMEFTFDYCYWSVDSDSANFAPQELVYQDLGTSVLSGAIQGYNVCLFAYGQTGSGKTYTMMGTPGLFSRVDDYQEKPAPCSIEISFLEIYNERVRDLLKRCEGNKPYTLRVREHPEKGPYVQGLSQHLVSDYKQLVQLLEEGIANRITAATHIHDASSRSHAIFTIHYTQAILENDLPSEIVSKINLVDLAGSERADPNYSKDRITEGSNINKSLVTLGIVISTLAQNSQISSSYQSINTVMSEGDSGSHSSASSGSSRRQYYVPYRDSVLTWLLKDSLGGNSKTIMIATISPASTSYTETISTLRYAAHAKNIVNKPRVNEDANVKLIRELREEIDRLKSMLMSFGLRNLSSLSDENDEKDGSLTEILLQNELKVDQLTKDWTDRWKDTKAIMEEYYVDINRRKTGVIVASQLPHLIAVDEDILSTGVCLYHLREGITKIGRIDAEVEQDIVLQGPWVEKEHCFIRNDNGVVTLEPIGGSQCIVNELDVAHACHLSQGAVIVLGKVHKFRFNHPTEAAKLRQRRTSSSISLASSGSCEWLDLDGECNFSPPYVLSPLMQASLEQEKEEGIKINETRRQLKELQENKDYEQKPRGMEMFYQQQIYQQQSYVEELRQHIQATHSQAEQELKYDQEQLRLRVEEDEQHLANEEKRLVCLEQQRQELGIQTDSASFSECGVQISSQVEEVPFIEQNRKRLLQLELLQRHMLRKAEQSIRKKRIRYQLESIAKKHKLLEAKTKLQQLKSASLITRKQCRQPKEGKASTLQTDVNLKLARWNKAFPANCLPLRRHSLSVPFLTRRHLDSNDLYAQHVPVYSDFLKRKNWSTSAQMNKIHSTTQKSLSMGSLSRMALPVTRTQLLRGRSEKVSPSWDQLQKKHKGVKHKDIIALKQSTENDEEQPKILELSSVRPEAQTSNISKNRVQKSGLKACSLDNQSITDKQLELTDEDVKKDLSWNCTFISTSTNICKRTSPKQSVRTRSFCRVNQSEHFNKEASVVNLAHLWENVPYTYKLRKWNSDEILNASITAVPDDSIGGWLEEEQLSDTDSLYSVDSLSSAYVDTLTEQLQKEEPEEQQSKQHDNCNESDDSEMSQDSLAEKDTNSADSFHDIHCARPHSKTANRRKSISLDNLAELNETSVLCRMDSPVLTASDEMPAEVYWNLPWSEVDGKKTYQNSEELIEEKECVGALTLKEQCFNVVGNTELKDINREKNILSKNLKTNKKYMDFPNFTDAQSFFESSSKSKMERVSSDNTSDNTTDSTEVAISSGNTECYENVGTELMKAAEANWIGCMFNFDQLQPHVMHNFNQVTERATYKDCHVSQNANNQGMLDSEEDSAQIQEMPLSPFATAGVTVQSSQCIDHEVVCVTGVLSTAEMKVKHSLTDISPLIPNVSDNIYSAQQSYSQTEYEDLLHSSTSNTLKLKTFSTDAVVDMKDADSEIEVSGQQCKGTELAKNCSQSQRDQLSNSDYRRNDAVHVNVSVENAAKLNFSSTSENSTTSGREKIIMPGTLSHERGEFLLKDKSLEKLVSASANNPNHEDSLNCENTLFLSGTQDQKSSILPEETSVLSSPVYGQNAPISVSEQLTGSAAGIWNRFHQDSNIVANSDKLPISVNFSTTSVLRHHLSQCLIKMTEQINKQADRGSEILLGSNTHRSEESGEHQLEISNPQDTRLAFRNEIDTCTLDKEGGVIQNNTGTELRVKVIEVSNTRAVEFTGDNISTLASTCCFEDCPTVFVTKDKNSQSKFKNNMINNAFKGDLPKTDSSLPEDLTERSVTMWNAGYYKESKERDVGIEEQMDDGTSQNVPSRTARGTGATLSDVECDQKEITCVELTQRDNIVGDCPAQYKTKVNSGVVQVVNSSGATRFQRTSVQNGRFSVVQTDAQAGTSSTDLADSSETCALSDVQEIRTMCGTRIGNEQNEIITTQHVIAEKLNNDETKAFEKGTEIEDQGISENLSKYCAEQTCTTSFIIENDCTFRERDLSSICTCTETSGGAGASRLPLQDEIIGTDHEAGEANQESSAVAQNFLTEIPNSVNSVNCENISNNEEQKVSPEELQLIKKSNPATFQEVEIFESALCQESTDHCEACLTTAQCDVALHSLRGHRHSQVGRLENSGIMDSIANPGSPSNGVTAAASTECDVSNATSIHCLVPVEYSPLREKQHHRLATESPHPEFAESRATTDGYMCFKGIVLLQHSDRSPSLSAASPHDTAPLEPNKDTVEREVANIGVEAPASCLVLKAGPEVNERDGRINQPISKVEEYSTHSSNSALPNQGIVLKEVIGRHVIWGHPGGTPELKECEFQDDQQIVDLHLSMLGPQYLKTGIETIVHVKQKYLTSKTVSSGENIANMDIADATVPLNICKGPTCLQYQNTAILPTGLNVDPSRTFQGALKTDNIVVGSCIPTTSTLPSQSKVFQNQTVFQGSSVQDVGGSHLAETPQKVPDSFADQPDALDESSCISSGTDLLKQERKPSQIAIVHTAAIQTALVEDDTKTTIVPGLAGLSSFESKLCAEELKITAVTKNQVPIQQGLEQVVHVQGNGSLASNLKKTEAKCHDIQFSNSYSVNTLISQSFIKSPGHHKQAELHSRREEDYSICFNDRDPVGLELTGNSSNLFVTPEQQTAVQLVNHGEEFVTFEFMALPKAVKCDMNYNKNDIFDSAEDLIKREESGIEDCEETQALLKGDLTDFKEMSSDVDCHDNNQRILIDIKKEIRSQFPPKIQKDRRIGLSPSAQEIPEQEKPRLLQKIQNHIIPQCESSLLQKDWNSTRITLEATETHKHMSSHISDLQVTRTDNSLQNDEPNAQSLLECTQIGELDSPFRESAEMDGTYYFSDSYLSSRSCHSDGTSVNQVNESNIEGIESSGSEFLDGSDDRCATKMMNGPKKKSQRRLKRIKPDTDEVKGSSSSSEEIDIEFLSLNKLRSRQCRRGINRSVLNVCKCKDTVSTSSINFESCALNSEVESKASSLRLSPSVLQEASPSVNLMMEGSSGHCLDPLLIDKPSEGLTQFEEGIVYQMKHETEDVERKHKSKQCFQHNILTESASECVDLHVATCSQTVHSPITSFSNQGQGNQSDKQQSEGGTSLTSDNNLSNSAEATLKAQEFSIELTFSEEKDPVHFACGDVDPYIHEQCKARWKQCRLGNAGTVHEVRTSVSNLMKCFSDSNGSNDHNHSDSHSYANVRTISTTLLPNDSQEASLAAMYPGNDNLDGDSCVRSCDTTMAPSFTQPSQFPTSESENINYQVDEIMLLYPGDLGSSLKMMSDMSVKFSCNKETQTSVEVRHQEQLTPQKSYVQAPAQINAGLSLQPDVTKLLHSSTRLLGNIGNNEDYLDPTPSPTNQSSGKMRPFSKVDGHTQSASDVATQTDAVPQVIEKYSQEVQRPQEVNVIVKVIGSEVNVNQDRNNIMLTLQEPKQNHSVSGLNVHGAVLNHSGCSFPSGNVDSSFRTSPVSLPAQKLIISSSQTSSSSPSLSPVTVPSQISMNSDQTQSTSFGTLESTSEFSKVETNDPMHSADREIKLFAQDLEAIVSSNKNPAVLVDRASSPIKTLEVGQGDHQSHCNSFLCLQGEEICAMQQTDCWQRKAQLASWYGSNENRQSKMYFTHFKPEAEQVLETNGEGLLLHLNEQNKVTSQSLPVSVKLECRTDFRRDIHTEGSSVRSGTAESCEDHHVKVSNVNKSSWQCGKELTGHSVKESIPCNKGIEPYLTFQKVQRLCTSNPDERKQMNAFSFQPSCWKNPPVSFPLAQINDTERPSRTKFPASCSASSFQHNPFSKGGVDLKTEKVSALNNQTIHQSDSMNQWSSEAGTYIMSETTSNCVAEDTQSSVSSECNTDLLLNEYSSITGCNSSQTLCSRVQRASCSGPEDLPLHNKFYNWSGVNYRPPSTENVMSTATSSDKQSEQMQANIGIAETMGLTSEDCKERWKEIRSLRQERTQILSGLNLELKQHQLTVELAEAKLNYGLGETDALLRILQSGAADDQNVCIRQQLYERHMKTIEILRKERNKKIQKFRRTRSLSPETHLTMHHQKHSTALHHEQDLPSKRRTYLQRLRKDIVENTRTCGVVKAPQEAPSEIEILLRDYQKAREETKAEIAKARDKLRARAEKEKCRLQQEMILQLLKEEERLRKVASRSSLHTGSNLSLSSNPTSGYSSSNTASPDSNSQTKSKNSTDPVMSSRQTACCNSQSKITEVSQDFDAASCPLARLTSGRIMKGNCHPSSTSLKKFQDLAALAVASVTAEIMMASVNHPGDLFSGKAAAGWRYHSTEKGVLMFYKPYASSTKHGFMGIGVIDKPLHSVWCVVKDNSRRQLYDKTLKTVKIHQQLGHGIELVYLVMDTFTTGLNQPRDFCCISVEAVRNQQYVLAMNSIYEESMPRPVKDMVRGEMLPSGWILQPDNYNGKEITRLIYLTQVDLGAPALHPRLLGSLARQQPLCVANLLSLLS